MLSEARSSPCVTPLGSQLSVGRIGMMGAVLIDSGVYLMARSATRRRHPEVNTMDVGTRMVFLFTTRRVWNPGG